MAKTWSKLRFSPMITMTCLIGDAVVLAVIGSWAGAGVGAASKRPPSENWNIASEVNPMRKQCIEFEANA